MMKTVMMKQNTISTMSDYQKKFGFTPSPYQENIFNFVEHGVGNAVISAVAGSGKTTTIVSAMKLIPKKQRCIFIAFNKSIVEELSERMKGYDNVQVKTAHSLGLLMVRRNLGEVEIDEYKYRTYLKSNIADLTSISGVNMTRHMIEDYLDSITKLIDYSRFNLAQSVREIEAVANKYEIPVSFDECEVALKCLEWGKSNTETVDYTDMVWLPYELSLRPSGLTYDWVLVDECQDMSLASIQLFLRCFKRGTRFIAVGDEKQSINQFAGASEEAFNFMKNYKNTVVFNLPITYRCCKNVVKLANTLVPEITARDGAPDGEILTGCSTRMIKDGDMVLARSRSPLIKLYTKLIKRNVNCYIKGQDIGKELLKLIEDIDEVEELNSDLSADGIFIRVYDKMLTERNNLMRKRGLDVTDATLSMPVMNMYDSISSLLLLADKCKTKTQLVTHIMSIFSDDEHGVCLSTVHKAKGLEADNVYILCHSTMPSKLATQEWEKQQEQNLMYVAYTRAKKRLGFVSEKEISPSGNLLDPQMILDDVRYIETRVCEVLGKEPVNAMDNVELARFQLKAASEVGDMHENDNSIEADVTLTIKGPTELLADLAGYMDD